jgi:hypothetical protein
MNSPHTTSLHIDHDSGAVDMHWAFEQSADCIKIMGCDGS